MSIVAADAPDLKSAVQLIAERKYSEALRELRALAHKAPDDAQVNFHIGRVFLELFLFGEAIPWFRKSVELAPKTAQCWQGWAEGVALGGGAEDRAGFQQAIKSAPINDSLRLQLQDRFGARRKGSRPNTGGVQRKTLDEMVRDMGKGAYARAEAMAGKVLSAAPKSAVAAFIQADAQDKQGKTPAALAGYQHAIKLDPLYAEAYGALGQLLLSLNRPNDALKALRPAVILAPDLVPALACMGIVLSKKSHHREAITLLERAGQLAPKNPAVLMQLGDAHLAYGDHESALAVYEKALLVQGKRAQVDLHLAIAECHRRLGADERALEVLEHILSDDPGNAAALMSMATVRQGQGDFDGANDLFREALEHEPTNGEAYRQLFTSKKAKPDDPLIERMKAHFARDDLKDVDRVNLGFALSKALEDIGDDAHVFQYLNEANRIVFEEASASAVRKFAELNACREVYSAVDFQALTPAEAGDLTPIFVTGLPRSGTTLVEQIIAAHSSVESGGELGYASVYCRPLLTARPGLPSSITDEAVAQVGRDYVQAIAGRFPGVECLTDKSINTFQHIGALKRALPKARFIVVRRDPRDNLLSIYKNKFADGTHGYAYDLEALARIYDEFDKTIAFWREKAPEWFYEVSYEALVSDPEVEARKLIAAAGLEWEDACLNFHKAKTKVQTLSVYQVRQPINTGSVKGWRRFEAELAPMIDQLRKDGHVTD